MSESAEHLLHREDAAAYVLGALEEQEAAAFRAHADACPVCGAEVARLHEAAAVLTVAAPRIDAPRSLKRRVLASAREDQRSRATPARPGRRRLVPRLELAGAVALVAGLAIGALLIRSSGGGTTIIRARVAGVSFWHTAKPPVAYLRRSGNRAELVIDHLPQAPLGDVYELWIERGGKPHPTDALFSPTRFGHADANVPGGVAGASAVLVTAEPRGGTTAPTMAPLIAAVLSD